MEQKETLAERLLRLRTAANLTQQQVATELGITDGAVSHWELGVWKPSIYRLHAIAALYGVSTDYLLDVTQDKSA